jgi:hypothetical protein
MAPYRCSPEKSKEVLRLPIIVGGPWGKGLQVANAKPDTKKVIVLIYNAVRIEVRIKGYIHSVLLIGIE